VAEAVRRAPAMDDGDVLVINVSGRGDKDVQEAARLMEEHGLGG